MLGTGHHWLGRLAHADGDDVGAREHLERAASLCDAGDAPFWVERARTDLAILATDPESWPRPRAVE